MKAHLSYVINRRIWVCFAIKLKGSSKIYEFTQGSTPKEAYDAWKNSSYSRINN
jgi:hypothetical protein